MKYRILLLKDLHASGKDFLREKGCEVIICPEGKLEEELSVCHAIFVRNEPVTREMMEMAPNLQVIAKHGTGYDNIDVQAATERGIKVVYAPLGNVDSVADMAMMLLLGCARRLSYVEKEFQKGNYNVRFTLADTHELRGKTLGLLGCGNVAKAVAKRAKYGFGMRVIGYSRHSKPGTEIEGIECVSSREEVICQADYLSIHMPSTVETKHSIGKREFAMMKKNACIINTSRGNILVEDELCEALIDGEIAGAGLDVFEKEPVDVSNPLLQMPNVICMPHCSGMTVEASQKISLMGAKGIWQVLNKEDITWLVPEQRK